MSKYPSISVVMPVFNTGEYLGEAIQSILMQSFTDFEFIIVNDGSTDNSLDIIRSFKDRRIKLVNNVTNSGNYPARNKGHRIAKGKYICVMDSDDVSPVLRFEKQFLYMEENTDVGISGGGFRYYGTDNVILRETDYENLKVILLRNNCFYHPALILRNSFLKKNKLHYNEKYCLAADYDLIVQGTRYFQVTNIKENLFHYRIHDQQNSFRYRSTQVAYADEIRIEQLKFLGIVPNVSEIALHLNLLKGTIIPFREEKKVFDWMKKIIKTNQKKKFYNVEKLESFLDALLSMQPFLNRDTKRYLPDMDVIEKFDKADLSDVTFLMILRIDSRDHIENANTVIRFLTRHFHTTIKILEADSTKQYFPDQQPEGVHYEFVEDNDKILHRNRWINRLIKTVSTPYFALWNADVIAPKEQVIEAINILRSGEVIISLPHDGRFYYCDSMISDLFRSTMCIDFLQKHIPVFELIDGFNSLRGAYFANKIKYLATGIENENIFSLEVEDAERIKRMEVNGLSIFHSNGPMFNLWHSQKSFNKFESIENELNNRKEFLKTVQNY